SKMRKPNPGMLLKAAEEMDIDLENSWMVGDSYRDVAAGKNAGCRTILINSPAHPPQRKKGYPEPDKIAVNVKEAANIIKMYDQRDAKSADNEKAEDSQQKPPTEVSKKDTIEHLRTFHSASKKEAVVPEETSAASEPLSGKPDYPNTATHDKTETLLQDVVNKLNRIDRAEMFEESSLSNVAAVATQVLAGACLLISIWFLIDQTRTIESVIAAIGYAIALQLIVITICFVKRQK
ncbi:MAG: HAD hydrolase-like protein, partial [Planctomycetes bacterium]|nr:HAD hydrolase-like protein [Planctomycetota bacterium]